MPLTLVLTRHAKSDWGDPSLDDHGRPLNARGQRAALAIGRWIATRATPDATAISTARRAVETWEGIAPALSPVPQPHFLRRLYHAAPDTMFQVLRQADGRCILMIAHNPGIAALADMLLSRPPPDPEFGRYPTGATLIAQFPVEHWRDLRPGTGEVVDFAVPRALGP